jgi:hypothetical protein
MLKLVKMAKNTLGVISAGVLDTKQFFDQFIGQQITFWVEHSSVYFGIDMLTTIIYTAFSDIPAIVFLSSNDNVKFAVEFGHGFGFKVAGSSDHYWVDNMNEKDCMVIHYRKSE